MLGDTVATALERCGITPDRVERWLGVPCGCEDRQEKLNQLHAWAKRVIKGRTDRAVEYINEMLT